MGLFFSSLSSCYYYLDCISFDQLVSFFVHAIVQMFRGCVSFCIFVISCSAQRVSNIAQAVSCATVTVFFSIITLSPTWWYKLYAFCLQMVMVFCYLFFLSSAAADYLLCVMIENKIKIQIIQIELMITIVLNDKVQNEKYQSKYQATTELNYYDLQLVDLNM